MTRLAAVLFIVGLFLILTAPVKAHHQEFLPIVPNTPIMKSIKATQEYTWCLNARAQQYPQFAAQVKEVSDAYTRLVGIKNRQVDYGAACQVRHDMRDDHPCGGCAAWVFYANNPVTIEYKATVGYVLWQTTIGHELGHALLGLHEQYIDLGTIVCDSSRTDTVMSCGTGVRYPQIRDITLGCSLYQTPWCGTDATITCDRGTGDPRYDSCLTPPRWVFSDGWSVDPVTQNWWNPQGQIEWSACNSDGLRWNYTISAWMPPPSAFWLASRGYWSSAGPC